MLEDLFLLWKNCHIWHYWHLHLYAFIESGGKLIPIYFNYDNLTDFDIPKNVIYDKIDVIRAMKGKEKISLLLMKLVENTMVFKSDVISEWEIQSYYNSLFKDYYDLQIKRKKRLK